MKGLHEAFDEAEITNHSMHKKAHGWIGVVNVAPEDQKEAAELLRENGYYVHSFEDLQTNVDVLLEESDTPTKFTRIKFGEGERE
jgi:hypothetical protein